jgi:hypothetical protein
MTVQVAQRAVIELGARTTVLEAMDRVRAAPQADEIVLSVAAGAPVLRSQVFLEVLRRAAASRRIALVTPDGRARSLAASVHMPAFASVAALERHEMDATEPLGPARRAAIVAAQPKVASPVRRSAVALSLFLAALVLSAIVAPTATVVVALPPQALGPLEYDLRAGPNNADINAQTLGPTPITAKFIGTATGSRTEDVRAAGVEKFTNQTTNAVNIPKGTIVSTRDNIRFQTSEAKTLPASSFTIFPPSVTAGTVDIPIEALDTGTRGNVGAHAITQSTSNQFSVDNAQPTTGGDSRKIPIVQLADYTLATSRADGELQKQGDAQMDGWKRQAGQGKTVYGAVVKRSTLTPAGDVVGKELPVGQTAFELVVTGTATGYSVADTEPRAATIVKLQKAAESGFDVEPSSAAVQVLPGWPTVADDGVHWRVSGRASQFRRLDEAAIRSALAGRAVEEVKGVMTDRGLRLVRVSTWPGWWPRLPVLDSRIQIQKDAPAATGSP